MKKFELPKLPYSLDGLEPLISKETLEYHYGKHHQAYVNNLNNLLSSSPISVSSLEQLVKETSGSLFNNAAQVWNHSFYWHCMSPELDLEPSEQLVAMLADSFGSFTEFKEQFVIAAKTLFGSGWVWLVQESDGNKLKLRSTRNADTPITDNELPLLVCDVWEHAYYVDVRNSRPEYINNFWRLINWRFVEEQLTSPYSF